jgi:hypothetical protein
MSDPLDGLQLTETEKHLLDLRLQYDEQLKGNEECLQRLAKYAVIKERMDSFLSTPSSEEPQICTEFTVNITPYLLDETGVLPPPR